MYIRNYLTYKLERICVFLTEIEKFSELNYSQKASSGNWKEYCDYLQKILTSATMENRL